MTNLTEEELAAAIERLNEWQATGNISMMVAIIKQLYAERQQRDVVGEDVVSRAMDAMIKVPQKIDENGELFDDLRGQASAALSALPASLPRLSVEEVAGVIRGEFIGRDWLSTPMGVMVHDITSAIRNNFPQLFKE